MIYRTCFENRFSAASAATVFEPACIAQLIQVGLLRRQQAWLEFRAPPCPIPDFRITFGIKRLIMSFLLCGVGLSAYSRPDQVSIYAGAFDLLRDWHRTFEMGVEYKFAQSWSGPIHFLEFRPLLGIMANAQKSTYLYGGINFDLYPADWLVIAPGFALGWYHQAEGKNLGFPVEFRTSIEMSWQFPNSSRLGVRFYHLSNANFSSRNPGEESLVLIYDIPVKWRCICD
ncbi:MAG: hypothetical protein HW387_1046 [Parachlamydiales bacterium]|nr:hypothetical protein [Parachlamydiales bacterium]